MWFECSECGGHVLTQVAPRVCPECGVAGAIFMPADPDDLMTGDSDGNGLRASWLRTGIERPDLVGRA
ncbi:MAG TPA: hypothetical protein VMT03_16190 [Polyangia bacterium]|nr:hypothetical protein [Polyangia bacterium]